LPYAALFRSEASGRAEQHGAKGPAGAFGDVAGGEADRQRHFVGVAGVGAVADGGVVDPVRQAQVDARGQAHRISPPDAAGSQLLDTHAQAWISRKPQTPAVPDAAQAAWTAAGSGSASLFTQEGK